MNTIESRDINCPYCGEQVDILIDCGTPHQEYIEDCMVCCRPIGIQISISDNGELTVTTAREDD